MGLILNPEEKRTTKMLAAADPLWRIERFFYIVDEKGRLVNFKANPIQRDFYNKWLKLNPNERVEEILLKARQVGGTTLCILLGLDQAIWKPNFTSEFISIDEKTMKKNFEKVKVAWENFSLKNLFPLDGQITLDSLKFKHGSVIRMAMSVRGGTVQFLHISELAKISRKDPIKGREILTGAFPAVHGGGRIIIESTAEGEGGLFHTLWRNAVDGVNGFNHHFYPWFYKKEYNKEVDDTFIASEKAIILRDRVKDFYKIDLTDEQLNFWMTQEGIYGDFVNQEYASFAEDAFLSSGSPVFDHKTLKISCKPKEPEHTHYVMGVDVADVGGDSSIIKVMNATTGEIVHNWSGSLPVEEFAKVAIEIGENYNYALVAWEANGLGTALRGHFLNAEYPNIYTMVRKTRISDSYTDNIGIPMGSEMKKTVIHELKSALNTGFIKLSDPKDLVELRAFQHKDNGKMEAGEGEHDDRVMALAIANFLCIDFVPEVLIRKPTRIEQRLEEIHRKRKAIMQDF